MAKFLIDTNVFIQAKNFHYKFCFCKGFWDLILDLHEKQILYSIKSVFDELTDNNNDELAIWINNNIPESFWLNHYQAYHTYSKIINWANNQNFTSKAIQEFAREEKADAWLVAYAVEHDFSIISQEKSNPLSKKKIYLADVSREFTIPYFTIYEFLTEYTEPDFCYKEIFDNP